jgi:hypothetical protein
MLSQKQSSILFFNVLAFAGTKPIAEEGMASGRRIIAVAIALLLLAADFLATGPAVAAELIMFTRDGCPYCAKFEAEVGRAYSQTDEGRIAPLRRVDVERPTPADLRAIPNDRMTPTFVLLDKGREIGRIRGYAGQDFFYGQLQRLLRDLPATAGTRS